MSLLMSGAKCTLGTRDFSRVQREFSVLAEGRHIFGRRPNSETGNRARKVSGTQGTRSDPQCDYSST